MEDRHAGTKFTVSKSMEKIRPALATLQERGNFKECKECGDPSAVEVCMACQLLKQIR
jgi:uncharacterized protein (TIGR00269 family)